MEVRFCDEVGFAFGWIAAEPSFLRRTSHALARAGEVWLVDAVAGAGVEERVHALGRPAGVLQLLDRHARDCALLARRLGVPHHDATRGALPDSPFRALPLVRAPFWREIALWWPERGVLVCADALGTAPYYLAAGERLAVHPLLRLSPPRRLGELAPRHVLCGHGAGIHGDEAPTALAEALSTSRRRAPRWLAGLVRKEKR